jgi:hypothetical protein
LYCLCRADHITLENVKAEYATGKSFVHDKPDNFGRPVLIIRANRHNPSERLGCQFGCPFACGLMLFFCTAFVCCSSSGPTGRTLVSGSTAARSSWLSLACQFMLPFMLLLLVLN